MTTALSSAASVPSTATASENATMADNKTTTTTTAGRDPGQVNYVYAGFIEAIARTELGLALYPTTDKNDYRKANKAKNIPAGKHVAAIDEKMVELETLLRDECSSTAKVKPWTDKLVQVFRDNLADAVAKPEPKENASKALLGRLTSAAGTTSETELEAIIAAGIAALKTKGAVRRVK